VACRLGATRSGIRVRFIPGGQYVLPASQGPEVYEKLSSPKQYHYFTAAESAEYHCAPMAPQTRNQVVFDWLDRTL
jgi:hypothetical protein